jgi:hypothetical protein
VALTRRRSEAQPHEPLFGSDASCITLLLRYSAAALLCCCVTLLLHYSTAALLYCCITLLLHYSAAALLYCCITLLLRYSAALLYCSKALAGYLSMRRTASSVRRTELSFSSSVSLEVQATCPCAARLVPQSM